MFHTRAVHMCAPVDAVRWPEDLGTVWRLVTLKIASTLETTPGARGMGAPDFPEPYRVFSRGHAAEPSAGLGRRLSPRAGPGRNLSPGPDQVAD
ncbi:hypothetical protein [Streptomyces sp. NBC_01618]|uniref:hypothetical protein n=1 Tax=Streptomyces sp. NBC_01618 TaxID=2975900 RepID=UPI00386C3A46|nr:hypothetical protein OH735_31380 [Streptomyces sp. NBC_01618]